MKTERSGCGKGGGKKYERPTRVTGKRTPADCGITGESIIPYKKEGERLVLCQGV